VKRKSMSQPTFVMVSPNTARAERAAMEIGAAELGLQLADAVAEMEVEPVKVLEADGTLVAAVWTDADNGTEVDDENSKQTKRWSRAPLLPDFDFSSASSNSNPLFDSMPKEEAITQNPKSANEPAETTSIVSDLRHAAAQAQNTTKLASADASKSTYRCSIHAQNGASHLTVERACCEIVTEAGGRVLDSYSFPGGFMFWLPSNVPAPITSCDLPARGVKIELERWSEFPLPNFDGLRLNPPSRTFNEEWLAVHSEAAQVEADMEQCFDSMGEVEGKARSGYTEEAQHGERIFLGWYGRDRGITSLLTSEPQEHYLLGRQPRDHSAMWT
jgi:hypothetical protein